MNFLMIEKIFFYASLVLYICAMGMFFAFFALKAEKNGKIANILMAAAFICHTLALASRGIGAGRLPLTNQYEFASSFAWGVALCYLMFQWRFSFKALGAFVTPVIIVIIGYAAFQNKDVRELMPALRSGWLAFHVSTAIIAYGSFGVACAVSAMFLLRGRMQSSDFWRKNVPEGKMLDMISYRAVSLGFLFLTMVLVTGAIWAEQAWGSYWSWDPKETWALITWFIYSIYLHLRISRGWSGKSAAIFAVAGFICVIFTYIGVNILLPGLHSYA